MRFRAIGWLVLVALWGCAGTEVSRIFHAGPADYQRAQAERFDPYPLPDIGPEVGGGRPLDFIRPMPENERVQNVQSFEDRFGQAPPPGTYRPIRGSGARQIVPFVPAPLPPPPGVVPPGIAPPGVVTPPANQLPPDITIPPPPG